MGRHSSPDRGPFYRSFLSWLGLWLMIAAVTGIAVWLLVGAIGGEQTQQSLAAASTAEDGPEEEAEPEPTVSGLRVANEPDPTPTETPASRPRTPNKAASDLITEGVTVQVLNGTMAPAAAQKVADRLAGLGYSIVTVEESSRVYNETTVFWSTAASREAAMALADHLGWVADPKPANLSDTVSFHVVVGADESN